MRLAAIVLLLGIAAPLADAETGAPASQALLRRYCVGCHNNQLKTAGVTFQGLDLSGVADKADLLERVVRKVKSGQMPPPGLPRPDAAAAAEFVQWLEGALDADAAAHPNPGRPAIH